MKTILVIDDESAIARIIALALDRYGYNVDTARNGAEGIAKFDSEKYDLVITDIRMPGVDGNAVFYHIRNSFRKTTPVIGISATPWLSDMGKFDAFLPKPFSLKVLTDSVKDLITHRRVLLKKSRII